MRSLIAVPPAIAVTMLVGCSHDPRIATPTSAEAPASPAPPGGSAGASPLEAPGGERDLDRAATASPALPASSSRAPSAPAPIEAELPASGALALSNKASCPAKTCRLEGSLLEALVAAGDSRSPVGIWEEDIGAGAAVVFARRADMDVLGVTLSGAVTLVGDEPKASGAELGPWHAFVAPGSGITLRAKQGSARLVLVVAAGETPAAKAAGTKAPMWTTRPAPIATVDLSNAPDWAWAKGAYHARIAFAADASPRASLGILKMSADGAVAPHVHEKEWEHMAVLQGEGDFIQGAGDEERTIHASDGGMFAVPPAARHQWKPAGSRSFLGIQVYTPPGPEQRFKKLAAAP